MTPLDPTLTRSDLIDCVYSQTTKRSQSAPWQAILRLNEIAWDPAEKTLNLVKALAHLYGDGDTRTHLTKFATQVTNRVKRGDPPLMVRHTRLRAGATDLRHAVFWFESEAVALHKEYIVSMLGERNFQGGYLKGCEPEHYVESMAIIERVGKHGGHNAPQMIARLAREAGEVYHHATTHSNN
jgi:hypothetical protein